MSRRVLPLLLILLVAACARGGTGPLAGESSPRGAVERFLAAARAKDLQQFAAVWGTAKGPARDHMERGELEKRELVLFCLLTHDQSRIGASQMAEAGKQQFPVELQSGIRSASTRLTVVRGPSDRWFVENVEVEPLRELCRATPPTPR